MKGKTVPTEVRNHTIKSFLEDGIPVSKLAKDHELNPNTIYTWIKNSSVTDGVGYDNQKLSLEVSRLKREKQELIDLIGRLTINVDTLKKKKTDCHNIGDLPKSHRLTLARVCIREYVNTNKKVNRTLLANTLSLNRSTLYVPQLKDNLDKEQATEIKSLLKDNPFYGHRRVAIFFGWSDTKARRLMRKYQIYPKYKKPRFLVKKHDLNNPEQNYQNHLKPLVQSGGICRPNMAWSTDFTYLNYHNSYLYLATVIDTYSKDIVGFHNSNRHTSELVQKALSMALRKHSKPTYPHSDQGSEYTSYQYTDYLKQNKIQISMSKKSSPWENGYQESFYGKFKLELGNLNQYDTQIEAIEEIILQLHYYNHKRIHTTIRDIPSVFRVKELQKQEVLRRELSV